MEILLAEDGLHPQKRSNMILPMFRSPFAVALWVVALTSPLQAMRADAFACTQSEVSRSPMFDMNLPFKRMHRAYGHGLEAIPSGTGKGGDASS